MDDDDYYGLNDIIIVAVFFLIWNTAICFPTVEAFSNLLHGECPATPVLICPHWIIGIALPIFFGHNTAPGSIGISLCCLSFVLPYTIGIYIEIYDRWTSGDDAHERSWLASGVARTANYMSVTQSNSNDTAGGRHADLRKMSDKERARYLEQILLIRKVISESKGQEHSAEHGYYDDTIYQEKIDIITPRSSRDSVCPSREKIYDEESLSACSPVTTKPERICSICLDDYVIGEEVCWSQNPDCYHAFHKDCIIAWLMEHKDCPVCRREYLGSFSDEETG
mmetsp:Transcript_17533/g.25108  ORF Transcript_17533/g.25108 Transcript_17533/m.25108 type:complete len:281 (+) Transcript_17533:66-908(+)